MERRLLIILAMAMSLCVRGENHVNLDSLYTVLDAAIDSADIYLQQKLDIIAERKDDYLRARSDSDKYECAVKIYKEYEAFDNDSAIHYQYVAMDIAKKMGRKDFYIYSHADLAYQLGNSGFYNEARIHYEEIPTSALSGQPLIRHFYGQSNLYGDMGYYSHDPRLRESFFKIANANRDSILSRADTTSTIYVSLRNIIANNQKKPELGLYYNDRWMKNCPPNSRLYAIMAFHRSESYKLLGDVEHQRYWLIQSALVDVRNAIMDQGSLWSLANSLIRDEGDLDRAYKYMDFSWGCISRFSPHMRSWQVSPILTRINDEYKAKLHKVNSNLQWTVGIISLLTLVLLGMIFYISKKRKELAVAHEALTKNASQLSLLNQQLKETNQQLASSNMQLHDSNRVKDEYITKFLQLCSEYIDKLDNYRIRINRKVKANQFDDLRKLTGSQQMKEDELKELFGNFDSVFLHLFPTFVDEFNALLKPEDRIVLTEENRLTTDLRIFALIRLGIDESSRIAEFLRYSPNSIYNYRARIKNKALGDREEFEQRVKEIGINNQ